MTTHTCTISHIDLGTRYCGQCGTKIDQPLEDLRAHLRSQAAKAGKKGNEKLHAKWVSWIDALDERVSWIDALDERVSTPSPTP